MSWLLKRMKARLRGELNLERLVKRGLVVGKDFTAMGGVIIDPSHCWHIRMGDQVTLAPRVQILAHDASTKIFLNHTRVANTVIGDRVFVGAGSIILPGITIGNDVVIGAGSVVTEDIPSGSVAVGNPARVVKPLQTFLEEQKQQMNDENVFDASYTLRNPQFSEKERRQLLDACEKYKDIFIE